jgi:hypothetical protein
MRLGLRRLEFRQHARRTYVETCHEIPLANDRCKARSSAKFEAPGVAAAYRVASFNGHSQSYSRLVKLVSNQARERKDI